MRIVVRLPNWVGDAVMAVPALRELRRMYPEARITYLARPWVDGLFEGEGLHDDVIPVEDAAGIRQSVRRFFREVRQLKAGAFDSAVLLTNSFGTALTARAARIPRVIGYATDRRGALLHTVVSFDPQYRSRHQVYYYLQIAAEINELERRAAKESDLDLTPAQPQLQATASAVGRAQELFEAHGLHLDGPTAGAAKRIVAVNPGATNSQAKQWLAERFAAAADRLAEQDGFQTVIIGATGDREIAARVQSLMRTPAANLAGCTSIAELKGVLSLCQLTLSNDTGAAHVAAALGVPTVVIFGPTEHFATHPLSHKAAVVRQDVECSPCMLRTCPIDHRCMTNVQVDDVYLTAKNLLTQETGKLFFDA